MGVRMFTMPLALLLALVFQLAWLPLHAAQEGSCGPAMQCDCCDAVSGCSCIADENPAPATPQWPLQPGTTAELPQLRCVDARVTVEGQPIFQPAPATHDSPAPVIKVGYHGVKLSVAFCSFLI
jgi:hypothetical protein